MKPLVCLHPIVICFLYILNGANLHILTTNDVNDNSNNISTNQLSYFSNIKFKRYKRSTMEPRQSFSRPSKWEPFMNELFPRAKSISDVRFYLYTRMNPDSAQELCINDMESIRQSNFDFNKRTVFLVNGWQDNRFLAKWVRDGIRLLLNRDDQNVIFVGWRSLKELFVAAMIIRSYSVYLAEFIDFLKLKYHINGEQIYCIGHSLGGFLCGFAGDLTYIGRVTVLDAGPRPYYQHRPSNERINRYQAGFMDVIHSDFHPTFSLGLTIPFGDLDFFPNAGTIQPGCWRDKWYQGLKELNDEGPLVSMFQIPRYLLFCSHYRSHEWFFESIWNDKCQFVGVLCPSYQMFIDGECSCEDIWSSGHADSTCALMGYDAEYAIIKQGLTKYSPQGSWFLKTSDFVAINERHCQYQYQLVAQLGQFLPYSYQNTSLIVNILAKDRHNQMLKIVAHEILQPRYSTQMEPKHRLSKLMITANSLPLSNIDSIYISLKTEKELNFWIAITWIKISPIHIVNNKPIFFCHLNHYLKTGASRLLTRCSSGN